MRIATAVAIVLIATVPAFAESPEVVVWQDVPVQVPGPELDDLVPADARIVRGRSGELLRLSGVRPQVGRIFTSQGAAALLDETDALEPDGKGTWRWVIPLGSHDAVMVRGVTRVERAEAVDVGYAWEVYEDRIVTWADGPNPSGTPPEAPTAQAQAAWIEANAVAILLGDAGAHAVGGRDLAAAVALEGIALARPLVGPGYRPTSGGSRERWLGPPRPFRRLVEGPIFLRLRARAARSGPETPSLIVSLAGRPVAGGPIGPAATTWVVRVPAGSHEVALEARGGPVQVATAAFRKREHLADAVSGEESIDHRAALAQAAGRGGGDAARLVAAEARRLRGDRTGAAQSFAPLVGPGLPPAIRAYAAWRLGELAPDAAMADSFFAFAQGELARLSPEAASRVAPALASARLRRALMMMTDRLEPQAWSQVPGLFGDPQLAPALVGNSAPGLAWLAAALKTAPPRARAALRRAYFDRTRWTKAKSGAHVTAELRVLTPADRCRGGLIEIGTDPVTVEIAPPALGKDRFRRHTAFVFAPSGPALDMALVVDRLTVPVPAFAPLSRHELALSPGAHVLAASGQGQGRVLLDLPRAGKAKACFLVQAGYPVPRQGLTLPLDAPAGSLLGLELRVTGPLPAKGHGWLEVDGRRLAVTLVASAGAATRNATHRVSAAATIDIVAADPRSLRLHRDGSRDWFMRPLLREARWPDPEPLTTASVPLWAEIEDARRQAPSDVAGVRRLSMALRSATTTSERRKLHLIRAAALAGLGRHVLAEEDVHAAAGLDLDSRPYRALVADMARSEDPLPEASAYALDPAASVLWGARGDPRMQALAAAAYRGDLEPARRLVRVGKRHEVPEGALALVAIADRLAGDARGASAAYGALADRRPDLRLLRVAEARAILEGARTESAGPDLATRALVAASLAGNAPGASDARARALAATRWRRIRHAEGSLGSLKRGDSQTRLPAIERLPAVDPIRAAVLAPELEPDQAFWLEPGQTARAVVKGPVALTALVSCGELRPHEAASRGWDSALRLMARLDGMPVSQLGDGANSLGRIPAGVHAVEIVLAPGGVDALCAVRLGADRHRLVPRDSSTQWLAARRDPVRITVLGPTVLRLEAAGPVRLRDESGALAMTTAGSALVPLPDERTYTLAIVPASDSAPLAVAAQVREDREYREDRTWPRTHTPSASDATLAASGIPPSLPQTALRAVHHDEGAGTFTVLGLVRDGAVGERDTATERGSRYGEIQLVFRRRRPRHEGPTFVQAAALARLRPQPQEDGRPTFGLGARAFRVSDPLRLEGGVRGLIQGSAPVAWIDVVLGLRLPVAEDWFLSPALGFLGRIGPAQAPGGSAVDPDVWSRFDLDHPRALSADLRLDWEPFLDLRPFGRLRVVSNADITSIDRASALAGVAGAAGRLTLTGSLGLEHRRADSHRPFTITRQVVRAGGSFSLWRGNESRVFFWSSAALRPQGRSELLFGLGWDQTGGRALGDYAPSELGFAGQLGPYEEAAL